MYLPILFEYKNKLSEKNLRELKSISSNEERKWIKNVKHLLHCYEDKRNHNFSAILSKVGYINISQLTRYLINYAKLCSIQLEAEKCTAEMH